MSKKLFLVSLVLIFVSAITLPKVFYAQEERIQYEQLKKKVGEAKTYSEALDIFRDYLSKYPSSIHRDEIEREIKIREIRIAKKEAVEMDFFKVKRIFSKHSYKNEFEERREAPKNRLKQDQLRSTLIYSNKKASWESRIWGEYAFGFSLGEYDFDLKQFTGRIGYTPPIHIGDLVQTEIIDFVSQDGSTFNFILRVDEKDAEFLKESSESHFEANTYLHIIYTPVEASYYFLAGSGRGLGTYSYEQSCLHIDLKYSWLTIKGSSKIFPLEIVQ